MAQQHNPAASMCPTILLVLLLLCGSFGRVRGNDTIHPLHHHERETVTRKQEWSPTPAKAFARESIATLAAYLLGDSRLQPTTEENVETLQQANKRSSTVSDAKQKKMRKAVGRKIRTIPKPRDKTTDVRFRTTSRGRRALERDSNIWQREETSTLGNMLRGHLQTRTEEETQDRQLQEVAIVEGQDSYIDVANQMEAHNLVQEKGLFTDEIARSEQLGQLGRGGFLDGLQDIAHDVAKGIKKAVSKPFVQGAAVGGAVGAVVGAGGLALILCATGTICGGANTTAPIVDIETSAILTITVTGNRTEAEITDSEINSAVSALDDFYDDVLGAEFPDSFVSKSFAPALIGSPAIRQNGSNTDILISYSAVSRFTDAEPSELQLRRGDSPKRVKGVTGSEEVLTREEDLTVEGKRGRQGKVNANGTLANETRLETYEDPYPKNKGIAARAAPTRQLVDFVINDANLTIYVDAYLKSSVEPTSVLYSAISAKTESTTTEAPSPGPTRAPVTSRPSASPTTPKPNTSRPSARPSKASPTAPGTTPKPTSSTASPTNATASPTPASPTNATASPTTANASAASLTSATANIIAELLTEPEILYHQPERGFDFGTSPDNEGSLFDGAHSPDADAEFQYTKGSEEEKNDFKTGPEARRKLQ
jgi:hypothetical protein